MLKNHLAKLSAGNRYYLLLIMLWVVSIAGSAQELLNNLPASQEDPVEQVRSLMKSYFLEPDEAIMYRIRDVVEQSGLNELTETAREHLVKANIYLEKQQYKNSIEEYQQVIVDSPWVFDAFFNLAHIYAADIQYTKAIETMQNYLVFQPQGARSRQARDAIYTWEVEIESTMMSLDNTRLKGISIVDLDENSKYFGRTDTMGELITGVIINEIDPGSQAWQRGMRKGDIIYSLVWCKPLSCIHEEFSDAKDFVDKIEKYNNSLPNLWTYRYGVPGYADSPLVYMFKPYKW